MKLSYAHICLKVQDLANTERFYTQVLGMKIVFRFRRQGEDVGFYLEMAERQYIEVFAETAIKSSASTVAHLCLEVDSIDELVEHLSANGIEVSEKTLGCDESYQVWFKDPDGLEIEVHEYTDRSHQVLGGDVEVTW
ncbi:MAG: VOC family protein [Planctomycetota bacterium]|jgi:lactoylglutathione lyase/glyoxylase I family protein